MTARNILAEAGIEWGNAPLPDDVPAIVPAPVEPEPPSPLHLITAAELASIEPERPDWILPGYIARGAVTELSAQIKAGKTTLLLAAVRAIVSGSPFLDRQTQAAPVVYLSEERGPTFRAALGRVGLLDSGDLHILFRSHVHGRDWADVAAAATDAAVDLGAGLLITDTLSDWAGVRGDDENDAGRALEAMRPLHAAAAAGLAVVSVRHDRKSGGAVGESSRGSSAFGGAADVIISLRRTQGQGHENRRTLLAVGRFDDTPGELLVDLVDGRYVACGDARDVQHREALEWLRENLPMGRDWAVTVPELVERAKDSDTDLSRSTLQRALGELVNSGEIASEKGSAPNHPRALGYWLSSLTNEQPKALTHMGCSQNARPNP